jgi:ABC-type multidrug transport system fused ATPase/permease subunit
LLNWPTLGEIVFNAVTIKYRTPLLPAVHNFSLRVPPSSRVGILGRTGSGKSSLFAALLRTTDLFQGQILIDGVDIKGVGLDLLRESIGVVLQEPTLFKGSLKHNLDLLGTHSQDQVIALLQRLQLFPGREQSVLLAACDHFSQGEKQLLCIARAMLKPARILLMDEPTSAVDYRHDLIVHNLLKHELRGRTVLTIAHRLQNVADYDRVVVMDQGQIVAQGAAAEVISSTRLPEELLVSIYD